MKKIRIAVVTVAVVALAAVLVAGTSYARTLVSPDDEVGQAVGCGGGAAMGDMHSTMWSSLAKALDVTTDQLDKAVAEGKSLPDFALEKGINSEQLSKKMLEAMKGALDEQVASGAISREQADAMIASAGSHMTPEHLSSMGNVGGQMHGGVDMGSMHSSMHGSGTGSGTQRSIPSSMKGMMGNAL
jgi:parvulin-like peptidyl-prolyl isomerase